MSTILIVDDDYELLDLMKSVLTKAGYNCLVAGDPQASIEMAKKEKPNLILMDVMLPGMDGAEIVKVLKEEPTTQNIPIIFLSGLLSPPEKPGKEGKILVDGRNYRALAKPFEINDLLIEIRKILK